MNEYDMLMEEESKAFHNGIDSFKQENEHLLKEKMNAEDFNQLNNDLKPKIALYELQKRQSEEWVNLLNNDYSDVEEENLVFKHQKEEEEFLKKQYALDDSTNINKIIDMMSQQNKEIEELRKSSKLETKKLITAKDFEDMYSFTEKQQGILRGKVKDPLPYIQTAERGNIYYDVKIVDKWVENYKRNMR